jgi:hypothetical protein
MSEPRHGLAGEETLLLPELYLPSQVPPPRRDSLICGEKALMLAVLEDAIRCLEAHTRSGTRRAREAETWIRANDHDWPFSFVNVCAHLDLDAKRLRAALLSRNARRRAGDTSDEYRLHLRLKPPRARLRVMTEPRVVEVEELPRHAAQG